MTEQSQEPVFDMDELYRRLIVPYWIKDVENGKISSAAFQNRPGTNDVSVDLARLTKPENTAIDLSECAVGTLMVQYARDLNQEVFNNPENGNIAHCTIRGVKTKSIRRKLAQYTQLLLHPLK